MVCSRRHMHMYSQVVFVRCPYLPVFTDTDLPMCSVVQVQHPDGRLTPFIRLVPIWEVRHPRRQPHLQHLPPLFIVR